MAQRGSGYPARHGTANGSQRGSQMERSHSESPNKQRRGFKGARPMFKSRQGFYYSPSFLHEPSPSPRICQTSVLGSSVSSFLPSQPGLRRMSLIRLGRPSSSLAGTVALGRKRHGWAPPYVTFLSPNLSWAFAGVAFEGCKGLHRHALKGKVGGRDRRAQTRDRKGVRLFSQARFIGPRLREDRRRRIHNEGDRAPYAVQQWVSVPCEPFARRTAPLK